MSSPLPVLGRNLWKPVQSAANLTDRVLPSPAARSRRKAGTRVRRAERRSAFPLGHLDRRAHSRARCFDVSGPTRAINSFVPRSVRWPLGLRLWDALTAPPIRQAPSSWMAACPICTSPVDDADFRCGSRPGYSSLSRSSSFTRSSSKSMSRSMSRKTSSLMTSRSRRSMAARRSSFNSSSWSRRIVAAFSS
jgi:hypothetical protein